MVMALFVYSIVRLVAAVCAGIPTVKCLAIAVNTVIGIGTFVATCTAIAQLKCSIYV